MRKKRTYINILFSLILELVTVVSGFVLPGLIIRNYGSDMNGLINSVNGFIGYISILQLGVGSVIKASLYKPLAEKNKLMLDSIIRTSNVFFKKIGIASIVYIVLLSSIFPIVISRQYDFYYTFLLVLIIGIGTVFQYLFGITYQMLLEADQKSYVFSLTQIVTIAINTIIAVLLIYCGKSIHIVKLWSAVIFSLRPIFINLYCKSKYGFDSTAKINNAHIVERWNGFAQGLAYFIHSKTDIFVVTILLTLEDVSIYSVYALVTSGLVLLVNCIDKSMRSVFGNILVLEHTNYLKKIFEAYNTILHVFVSICFSTASVMIFSFIKLYVNNADEAGYMNHAFGLLIITAEMLYCLRLPQNSLIFAAGKFKETKRSAFMESIINIVLSLVLVREFGLIGVAIGTMAAMIFRTISLLIYLNKNILYWDYYNQVKRYVITILAYALIIASAKKPEMGIDGYFSWAIYALTVLIFASVTTLCINLVFLGPELALALKIFYCGKLKNK